jgi:acyl-CoA reductase-like NAD-dependent aldehyde dehydrogenase
VQAHTPSAEQIRALHASLRRAAQAVRSLDVDERAALLASTASRLMDAAGAPGQALREALRHSTGLTAPVIEHGLCTTLGLFTRDALRALHAGHRPEHTTTLTVVVLAGNVFSASARPMFLPLLCGSAVLAKASSIDDVLPRHLQRALQAIDPRLGAALAVATFARGDREREAALLRGADLVSAYGSNETVAELGERISADTRLLAHGHGLGVIAIGADALTDVAAARTLAARAARDLAAYDQRGCLSPQAVLVQEGAAVDAPTFARLLHEALQALGDGFARGSLPSDAAAAQVQWRGVAAAVGELHVGAESAVSYEGYGPLRGSPGYRNVAVYECADLGVMRARLLPLGAALKALGIAGPRAHRALADLAPYASELGAMQAPQLSAMLDGIHPLAGLG